jgi:hypothetical protein
MPGYDILIIGSSAGGMTAAVALAQVGRLPWRARPGWSFSLRTEFDGLYLCGASTLSYGVAGVTQSGIDAAKAVLNCRTRDLLNQNGPSLTFLPSEDVSQWPEYLRRKIERGEAAREEEEREV